MFPSASARSSCRIWRRCCFRTTRSSRPNSSSTTITIDTDKTVIARFSRVYTLSVEVEGEGTINPGEGAHSYTEGTSVTISAVPGDGYKFSGWTGDVTDADSLSITITMDSDKTVTATFVKSGLAPWVIAVLIIAVVIIIGGLVWFNRRKPEVTE